MRDVRGTILVTTLWILSLLTLLALGIGIRMGVDIKLIGFALNSSKAHYLAEAGLRKAITLLEKDEPSYDALNEVWSTGFDPDEEKYLLKDVALGDGTFTVGYESAKDLEGSPIYLYGASDEEGKLNINTIDGKTLAQLGFSSEIVTAVLDWRDPDDLRSEYEGARGAEQSDYDELEVPYECKNAPFSAPEELMLVKGVTKEIYDGVKDIITVYGDGKEVNINTAPEAVLAVLIGEGEVYEALPGKIITHRNGEDEKAGTEDDNIFRSAADLFLIPLLPEEQLRLKDLVDKKNFKINSNTFRIVSRGELKEGKVKKTIEAVLRRNREGSSLLYYYED